MSRVPAGDASGMARETARLLDEPWLWATRRAKGLEAARTFSIDRVLDRLEEIFSEGSEDLVIEEAIVEPPARAPEVDAGQERPHRERRVRAAGREAQLRCARGEERVRRGPELEGPAGRAGERVGDRVEEVRNGARLLVGGLEVDEESPVADDAQDRVRAGAAPLVEELPRPVHRPGALAVAPVQDELERSVRQPSRAWSVSASASCGAPNGSPTTILRNRRLIRESGEALEKGFTHSRTGSIAV